MKNTEGYESDLAAIRATMERSAKFMSLSGLSGILAGLYALVGAAYAYYVIYYPEPPFGFRLYLGTESAIVLKLASTASVVLIMSLATAFVLSQQKARKMNVSIWNKPSKLLFINMAIPLATGGIFTAIMIANGYYILFASSTLIFYGLALISASQFTYREIRWLGISEIGFGLLSAVMPGFGLVFWGIGFGLLHLVYGGIMHYRYDR